MSKRDEMKEKTRPNRPASVGGQAAELGITAQYRYAAKATLAHLLDGTLDRLRLRDPGAAQVDDFQILTNTGFLHAYQVKWETDAGLFTLNDLIAGKKNSACLFRVLTDGWSNRRQNFPELRCRVHLVTPKLPSKHSACGDAPLPPADRHFAAFIREAWTPVHAGLIAHVENSIGWEKVWSALRETSDLPKEDFLLFVRACGLEFGATLNAPPQLSWRRAGQWEKDVRQLGERLISLAQEAPRKVEFSRDELLAMLGWPDDARTRNLHEWHRNEPWHISRRATSESLRAALDLCGSGYVALLGPPGSGKSTTLTEFLRGRPDTVRYYAFLRDEPAPAVVRGEAVSFLHDLGAMLEREGVVAADSSRCASDLDLLRERFYRHLGELHDHWRTTGRKTVLLVDGLDHIPSDRRVVKSLLDELPAPDAIPAGVVFLLGTQTLEVLPPEIAAQFAREPARRLAIAPLPADGIIAALTDAGLRDVLGQLHLSRAVQSVGGSPLLLAYLIRRLCEREPSEDVSGMIAEFAESGGDVGHYYARLWARCERAGPSVTATLALLSRLRHGFEIGAVAEWFAPGDVRMFRQTCSHLFKREGEHWSFFHNSFRRFAQQHSATFGGALDEREDARIHGLLAQLCAAAPVDSPLRWEELYHRAAAGDDAAVLGLSRPERFREQVLALRPVLDLGEDHSLVAQTLTRSQDALAFCRLVLAAHERDLRLNALQMEHEAFVKLLYHTAPRSIARRHLLRAGRLNLGHEGALAFLRELLREGQRSEAAEWFEVLGVSSGSAYGMKLDRVREGIGALADWVALAVEFWPVERVIEAVKAHDFLSHERTHRPGLPEMREWTQEQAVVECLALAAESCAAHGAVEASREIVSAVEWNHLARGRKSVWQLCCAQGWLLRRDSDEACRVATELRGVTFQRVETQLRHLEVCVRCLEFDEARRVLDSVAKAEATPKRTTSDWNDGEAQRVLRRYAACLVLGLPLNSPATIGERRQFRLACLAPVSWFVAEAWSGRAPSRAKIRAQLHEVFGTLREPAEEYWTWEATFNFPIACYEIGAALVEACGALGSEAMDELSVSLSAEWSHPKVGRQWTLWARQELTTRCVQLGASRTWAESWLPRWDAEARGPANSESRAGLALSHAAAWRAAGRADCAHEWAIQAVRMAFGFGYNDGWRLERWVDLLSPAWRRDAGWGLQSIARIARCLPGLQYEFNSHGGAGSTGERLVGVAFQVSPLAGRKLLAYFRSQELRDTKECALEIVRYCSALPHAPFDLLGESLADHLYVEDNAAGEEHVLAWFHGAVTALGWERAAALARALPRPRPWRPRGFLEEPWWRGLVVAALQAGHNPRELGLSEEDIAASRPAWAEGHRVTNTAVAVAVLEAANPVIRLRELRDVARAGREHSHSAPLIGWDDVLELALPRLNLAQLQEVTAMLEDEHHFQFIAAKIAPRLIALGARSDAWALGERAHTRLQARGRLDSASPAERLAALRPMLLADTARARPLLFATAAEHGLPEPDDLQALLPLLLTVAEQDAFAHEAQAFLETALDGCDSGASALELPISPVNAQTLRAALSD